MKPINLEIEGLQSFEEKENINFEHLCEYGLFGIFGPTGSGKSTILDAITLAIYGEVVRIKNSREDTLFDLLNINSDRIFVSFSFGIGEDIYKLERDFRRSKKDKKVSSKKVLMYKNDTIIGEKVGEIKEEVDKIIGLTMDDFTRSVLLPQGKFSDFLKLSGAERRQMLERLFDLEKYGRDLIYKVRGKKSYYSKEIEGIDNQIKGKGIVNIDEIKEIDEDLSEYKSKKEILEKRYEENNNIYREKLEVLNLVDEIKNYTEEKNLLDNKKEEILVMEKSLDNHSKGKDIYEKYESYEKEKENLDIVSKRYDEINLSSKSLEEKVENLKEKLNTSNKVLEKLEKDLETTSVSKEEWDRVAVLKLQKDEYQKTLDALVKLDNEDKLFQKEYEKLREKIGEEKVFLEELNNKLTTYVGDNNKVILDLEKELIQIDLEKVEKLTNKIDEKKNKYEKEKKRLVKLEDELKVLEEKINLEDKVQEEYWKGRFINELKDNCPCPICGSLDHDKKDEIHIEELEKIDYSADLINIKGEIKSINLEVLWVEVEELIKELDGRSFDQLKEKKARLEEEIKNLKEEDKKNSEEKISLEKEIEKNKDNYTKLQIEEEKLKEQEKHRNTSIKDFKEKKIEVLSSISAFDKSFILNDSLDSEKIDEYLSSIKIKEDKESNLKKEIKNLKIDINKIKEDLNSDESSHSKVKEELNKLKGEKEILYKNQEKYFEKYNELLEKSVFEDIVDVKKAILDDFEGLKEEIEGFKKKEIEVINTLKILGEKLGDRTTTKDEVDSLSIELDKIKKEKEEVDTHLGSLQSKKNQIEKALEEIKELLEVRGKLEKSFDIYEDLSKLFEGNKFVEYLALSKLRSIAKVASRRLGNISNGRYGLCTDENGNFLIVDNFNGGERRRSSTLSGGESFLVSLSLALALSSQIQLKGMAQLEFFFLDEGFGTLDNDLLEKVISSLENIRDTDGIKIGVISHVEELKERIPRRVEVSGPISGERGTKIKII